MHRDSFTHLRMFVLGWPVALTAYHYNLLDIPDLVVTGFNLLWFPAMYVVLRYSAAAVQRQEIEAEINETEDPT